MRSARRSTRDERSGRQSPHRSMLRDAMIARNAPFVKSDIPLPKSLLGLSLAVCLLLASACDIIPPSPPEQGAPTSQPQASVKPQSKGTIGIHAGHGNGDPGAPLCAESEEIPGIASEADITLAVANKVVTLLRDVKGYDVVLFRGNDSGAQGFRGDAFVSLHCDQCAPGAEGYKVSRYGGGPGTGLSGSGDASDRLVQALWDQFGEATGLERDTSPGHFPDQMRNYYLLGWIDPATPGAIIEMGWLSGDWHALAYEQEVLALGVANGILAFLGDTTITTEATAASPVPRATQGTSMTGIVELWRLESSVDEGEFYTPIMVGLDSLGQLYVVDAATCQIQVFNTQGEFLRRWGRCGKGEEEFVGGPEGIAFGENGKIYVTDKTISYVHGPALGSIVEFDSAGHFVRRWGSLDGASGITVDTEGSIYVIEQQTDRIVKFSGAGDLMLTWGTSGEAPGQFDFRSGYPSGVGIDEQGYVYVADMANDRVQKFTSGGAFVQQWDCEGSTNDEFAWPGALAVDMRSDVYVLDGRDVVQAFDSQGTTVSTFHAPGIGMAVTDDGKVIVSDPVGDEIKIFTRGGTLVHSWGATAYDDPGELSYAEGIVTEPTGHVYVSNTGHNAVAVFSNSGEFIEEWSLESESAYPAGMDVDLEGNVYVFDTNRRFVLKYSAGGRVLTTWGGVSFPADGEDAPDGLFNARCWGPVDLAVSGQRVYVADTCDGRVQVFDLEGDFIDKWGSEGSGPGELWTPLGIEADPEGNVYVADSSNYRIQKFSSSGEFITSWGERGSGPGHFESLDSIALTPEGGVLTVDTDNRRIQLFSSDGQLTAGWKFDDLNAPYHRPAYGLYIGVDSQNYVYLVGSHCLAKYDLSMP